MDTHEDALPDRIASIATDVQRTSAKLEELAAQLSEAESPRDAYPITSKITVVGRRLADCLGLLYVAVRDTMPAGPRRTAAMEALAIQIPHDALTASEIDAALQSADQGQRVVALSQLQRSGDVQHFALAVQVVGDPCSAFEQYRALKVMETMLPHLSEVQRHRLRDVLAQQRDYNEARKQWIKPGCDRWEVSGRLLEEL